VRRDKGPLDDPAGTESRELAAWPWGEVREPTERIAGGLRALGVREGDRIVGLPPDLCKSLAAMLPAASFGDLPFRRASARTRS